MRSDLEEAVLAIARRQHFVFRVEQAMSAGAGSKWLRRRVGRGAYRRLAHRVLAVAAAPATWQQRVMAAVLEAGAGAVSSHRTAAALLGIPGFDQGGPEVQKLRGRHHRMTLGVLHETFWLPPHHTTTIDGIPTTSLARCVFDLAGHPRVHPKRTARALDNALHQLGLSMAAVDEVIAAIGRSGKPGTTLMRQLSAERQDGYVPPASELEALFMAVVHAYRLPQPERQVDVGDHEWVGRIDFIYRDEKVIVEADGRPHHLALLDTERDDERRARLEAEGWRVVVVKWRQLVDDPELVVRRIRQALRRAGAEAA